MSSASAELEDSGIIKSNSTVSAGYGVDEDSEMKEKEKEERRRMIPKLHHLPNWWYSLALSTFMHEKSKIPATNNNNNNNNVNNDNSSSGFDKSSETILIKAISIWPYLLQPLLKRSGVQTTSSHWRDIFAHPFFATASSR